MTQASEGRNASKSGARHNEVFELKSASLSLLSLLLRSADLELLSQALQARLGETPEAFDDEPLLIDLSPLGLKQQPAAEAPDPPAQLGLLPATEPVLDLAAVVALLKRYRMRPQGLLGGDAALNEQAAALGLVVFTAPAISARALPAPEPRETVREVVREVVHEVVREVPAEAPPALVVDKPLRSGQRVYAKGGDLIVTALVNHGAEVIADGHIHVYAPLRGKAIAGARGNTEARIFAASLEAELVSIAGIYRTTENPLPDTVLGKAAQVRLDGERLVMEALQY